MRLLYLLELAFKFYNMNNLHLMKINSESICQPQPVHVRLYNLINVNTQGIARGCILGFREVAAAGEDVAVRETFLSGEN